MKIIRTHDINLLHCFYNVYRHDVLLSCVVFPYYIIFLLLCLYLLQLLFDFFCVCSGSLTSAGSRYATFHLPFFFFLTNTYILQNRSLWMATKTTYRFEKLNMWYKLTHKHQTVTRFTSRHWWWNIECKSLKSIQILWSTRVPNTHLRTYAVISLMPTFMVFMIHPWNLFSEAAHPAVATDRMVCHAHISWAPHLTQRIWYSPPFPFIESRE
jgi:hypothetical protein